MKKQNLGEEVIKGVFRMKHSKNAKEKAIELQDLKDMLINNSSSILHKHCLLVVNGTPQEFIKKLNKLIVISSTKQECEEKCRECDIVEQYEEKIKEKCEICDVYVKSIKTQHRSLGLTQEINRLNIMIQKLQQQNTELKEKIMKVLEAIDESKRIDALFDLKEYMLKDNKIKARFK